MNALRLRSSLTSPSPFATIRLILSDFVGQGRRRSHAWLIPSGDQSVSRRTVLKGMAGVAGLGGVPAFIAACSSSAATTAPSASAPSAAAPAPRRRAPRPRQRRRTGSVHIGSNHSDPGEKAGMDAVNTAFTDGDRDRRRDEHGRSQHVPGPDHELPRRHAGHRVHVVLRLPHEVLRRPGPQRPDRRRLGQGQGQLHRRLRPSRSSATTARSTASRSTTTRGRSSTGRASSRTRATRSRRPGTTSRRSPRRCRATASPRSPSATRTAGPRWARSTSSTCA